MGDAKVKKMNWLRVDKIEDSGKGYDRLFVNGEMVATVEPKFVKMVNGIMSGLTKLKE